MMFKLVSIWKFVNWYLKQEKKKELYVMWVTKHLTASGAEH